MIRDEIVNIFVLNRDKRIVRWFNAPCFSCVHQFTEYSDIEYSSESWPDCDLAYDDALIEKWVEYKKSFPFVESPNRCKRMNYFKNGTKRMDNFDCIGYGIWGGMIDVDYAAPSIAGSVIAFHERLSFFPAPRDEK